MKDGEHKSFSTRKIKGYRCWGSLLGLTQTLPNEIPPLAHPVHQCSLRRKSLPNSGVPAAWVGALGAGRPSWDLSSFCPPLPSSPSLFPLGKLKSELDILVSKCPEESLEGDMSSPNSTGTQVRVGRLYVRDLSETKAVIQVTLGLPLLP